LQNSGAEKVKKIITISFLLACLAGCTNNLPNKDSSTDLKKIQAENRKLATELNSAEQESNQLKKQLDTIHDFGRPVTPKDIYDLQEIRITKFTNIYDKDQDGKKETLLVYLQPIDEFGDIIKAVGSVEVQLWDLDKKAANALLGQWQIGPAQLKQMWFATIITVNYRLPFDVTDKVEKYDHSLTVKVKFVDYLTGKSFSDQKIIKPDIF
jgi:hypothetical protein